MSVPKVYKKVAIRDGKYYSCFVGVPNPMSGGHEFKYIDALGVPALEYKIGQVTEAPEGSDGIYCYADQEQALREARGRIDYLSNAGLAAVLECYPIGDCLGSGGGVRYPAVSVIREVWRETPKPPEPKWVDVTKECKVEIVSNVGTPLFFIVLAHKGTCLGRFATRGAAERYVLAHGYKVEFKEDTKYQYPCGGFNVYKLVNEGA